MANGTANAMLRGYARHERDEKRLRATGIKTIYRADKGETLGKFKMRAGELLFVVDGLKAFGEAKSAMVAATKLMASWGAAIVDMDTKLRSDRDGAEMMFEATKLRNLSPAAAKAMQRASVMARTADQMPDAPARRIWFDSRYSVADAIVLMGCSQRAAYDRFGPRNLGAGRRPK